MHLFYFIIYCMAYLTCTMLYRGGESIIYYIYALITPKPPLPQMRHILSVGETNGHNYSHQATPIYLHEIKEYERE